MTPTDRAAALFQDGDQLLRARKITPALKAFYSAQQLGFDPARCAAARWNCWMLSGEFERAWQESDAITALNRDQNRLWTGQSWNGKRVMLRCLHGLGDTIQFVRYTALLKETCDALVAQTHPQLVSLLEGISAIDRVMTWGPAVAEESAEWDLQMEVTELPRAFRSTISTIPRVIPYLQVPLERKHWASRWFSQVDRPRIGFAWEAGAWDSSRSIALEEFAPLFECDHFHFYVLQKEAKAASFERWRNVHQLECHAADILDTAALILNLDLVITVDTMTAHLAGALGRTVWILLPELADWRWMLERSDTPWYPTARLFRQTEAGDWRQLIRHIRQELLMMDSSGTRRTDSAIRGNV